MLHSILSKLPKPLDLEAWISRAIHLLERHPPESLSTWHRVSRVSVLKTSHNSRSYNLKEAENLFRKQCAELNSVKRRQDLVKAMIKHKRPMLFALSVLIGVSSIAFGFYSRKNGGVEALPGFATVYRAFHAIGRLF